MHIHNQRYDDSAIKLQLNSDFKEKAQHHHEKNVSLFIFLFLREDLDCLLHRWKQG